MTNVVKIMREADIKGIVTRLGIDRIGSNVECVIENYVPCCKTCNAMKSNLSCNLWFKYMKKVLEFRKLI